ncbi:MAG: PQQ-binding-like beta-propeller repeat protein [Gemmataceae bacterium]
MTAKRWLAGTVLLMALVTPVVLAQTYRRWVYSNPSLPAPEALARLNLHLAWQNAVPMDGGRDAFLRIEPIARDLIILTRSGLVTRIEAETGRTIWRTRVGKPYTILPYFAANSRSIYVIANATMISLDRETGVQKWDYPLPGALSAAPAVDEEQLYVPTVTTRLYAFYLPFVSLTNQRELSPGEVRRESLIYSRGEGEDRVRPKPIWAEQTNFDLTFRPLLSSEEGLVVSPDGRGEGFIKILRENTPSPEIYRFDLDTKVSMQPVEYGDTAFIGADDATLYAINMKNGKLRWRHTAGTAISRPPVAMDRDVFVTSSREGLARLDRVTGEALWRIPRGSEVLDANPDADRYLASNERFVYASDPSGRLLVLDKKRGVRLSMLDTTAFRFPVINPVTDRLYLAANDGLILCLHDRDQKTPIRQRQSLEDANSPLLKRLAQTINAPAAKETSLRDVLLDMRKKYGIHSVVAQRAFQEARQPNPEEQLVKTPAAENRPLGDHLQRILNQVNATYQVVENTILIIPGKPRTK